MPAYAIWRSLTISCAVALVILCFCVLISRSKQKGFTLAAFLLLLFYSYGHVFELIDNTQVAGIVIGRHRYLLPLWIFFAGIGIWKGISGSGFSRTFSKILNMVSAGLILFVTISLISQALRNPAVQKGKSEDSQVAAFTSSAKHNQMPDVYYLVVDSYGREDVLSFRYGFDNSSFVTSLEDLGFIFPSCTQSNYTNTVFSIASSLNMDYVNDLGVPLPQQATEINSSDFKESIFHSQVRQQFEQAGYQFVVFKALYPFLDIQDADVYIDHEEGMSFFNRLESLNFQYIFLRTTAMRVVVETQQANPEFFNRFPDWVIKIINPNAEIFSSRTYRQYQENVYALEMLQNLPSMPGPKFVYAHLYTTHQPFVFNPDGSMRQTSAEDDSAYIDQVKYANTRLLEIIQTLINESSIPPVIILQADHSYVRTKDRSWILNAYFLPDVDPEVIYSTITPVNTFRVIFNEYFGQNYALLKDQSYFSPSGHPYQLEVLPERCIP
jgi:preprotein translocase subunit SecG